MNGILTKSTKLQRVQNKYLLTTEGITHLRQIRTQKNTKKITTHNLTRLTVSKQMCNKMTKPIVTF